MASRRLVDFVASCLMVAGCSGQAEPRPQLLVVVDTNAPVVSQVLDDPDLSLDATVDTLRVDVIDDSGGVVDFLDVVAPDARDWPISFGVARSEQAQSGIVHLRLRAFRGALAATGKLDGVTTLEPRPTVTIDRLVDVELPASGKRSLRVLLDMGCLGRPARFIHPWTTCVNEGHVEGAPNEGLSGSTEAPAQVGSWPHARAVPCNGTAEAGRVCIPGGMTVLGDPDANGLSPADYASTVPLRAVRVGAFFMDEHEMTVGDFRELVIDRRITGELPRERDPADLLRTYCTWLGSDVTANDAMPLNCVKWDTAREACRARGGDLPTEAQWAHAAKGRGENRKFPWGSTAPDCCTASTGRDSSLMPNNICDGAGAEPVGSHPPTPDCEGDLSRDGIVDLGGSVGEFTRDSLQGFDEPCWSMPGVLADPLCETDATTSHTVRGGNWSAGPELARTTLRHRAIGSIVDAGYGFRCVYPTE